MQDLRVALARAKSGDVREFAIVVERFQDMAVGYAYSFLGDFHLAEDAAQEAFTEAYINLRQVYGPEVFGSWFKRIVFKHCDRLTRRRRVPTALLEASAAVGANDGDPASVAEERELTDEVHRAVDSLPDDARSVISLYYISDYSQREISDFLGVPVTTVKSRIHRARKQLKERMIDMLEENLKKNRPSNSEEFAANVTKVLEAVAGGDAETARAMLEKAPSLLHQHDDAERGHRGVTALHYAAEAGHLGLAEFLIARGSDLNARDESHHLTPLGWATVFPTERLEMAELLIQNGAQLDIWTAVALGKGDDVKKMVGANPQMVHQRLGRSDWRMQPIHLAAWKGRNRVVQVLLNHGADARSTDDKGTPLRRAEQSGHAEVARILRNHVTA